MKKIAALPLLGVSALSLGLVGLSVTTPVVRADTQNTLDSVFTVTVGTTAGLDTGDRIPTGATQNIKSVSLALKPLQTDEVTAGGYVLNNTANNGNLTVAGKTDDVDLANGDNKIAAQDGQPSTSKATWAIKIGGTTEYKAVPGKSGTALNVLQNQAPGETPFLVTYAASAAGNTQPGAYANTIQYTYTAAK